MESSRIFTVRNGSAADALMSQEVQETLWPFLGQEQTIKQAALQTDTKLNTMYVRVRRLLELGLLEITKELPRGGRNLKLYRSVAERFYVPYEVMSYATQEALQLFIDSPLERELRRNITRARLDTVEGWGYEIYKDEAGKLSLHAATAPGKRLSSSHPSHPAIINLWSEELSLDFEEAKAFQVKLYALFEEYKAKKGAQPYLFRLGLAPLRKE